MWIMFVLILPFLGVFIYLISQGQGMAERDMSHAQASKAAVRRLRPHGRRQRRSAAEIEKAKQLLDSGAITQAEYDQIKSRALASA